MSWPVVIGMMLLLLVLVVLTACLLAPRGTRYIVLAMVIAGFVSSLLKILIIQQTPQWSDVNPDALTYDLNARALSAHWNSDTVDAVSYSLRGLLSLQAGSAHKPVWSDGDLLSYSSVIGSHEWLYTAYVASWYWIADADQAIVIASNAVWSAFLPAAAFGIALALGASRMIALIAGGLALIDPSSGINASWLLKDTFVSFISMAALWGCLGIVRGSGRFHWFIAFAALGLLGGARFVAFVGLMSAVGLVCLGLYRQGRTSVGLVLTCVFVGAWIAQGLLARVPYSAMESDVHWTSVAKQLAFGPIQVFAGGVGVLKASNGQPQSDMAVQDWKDSFYQSPVRSMFRSVARTLFAPYPWVAISPGLNWKSFSELYYPGVVLWIICLPGVFMLLLVEIRRGNLSFWLIFLFLLSQFAAYTIWLGEWSTRQRVFVLPAIFAMAAMGWDYLYRKSLKIFKCWRKGDESTLRPLS